MITLSIVAAGIIALAAALLARPSPEPRAADQRGITLQTLIVTAVLVLMAVAAGVVIVAITNTQEERLQRANPGGDSKCEPWEIYDITRAAAGRGGGLGGIGSSGEGCVRVCYIRTTTTTNNVGADDDIGGPAGATSLELVFSRSNIASASNPATTTAAITLVVSDTNELAASNTEKDPDGTPTDVVVLDTLDIDPAGNEAARDYDSGQMTIEVAPNQKWCRVVDAQGDELLRSVDV